MASRIVALTRPLDQAEGISFHDLFNLEEIQQMQDLFSQSTSVASIITTPEGVPITRPSNFCRLCNDIIRKTKKGLCNCYHSDSVIGRHNPGGPIVQKCISGGLWDAGASISVGGRHIANWLIGQVRNEAQDPERMREYAREIGADEEEVVKAFYEVPVMSREQFEKVAQALFVLAQQLSTMAYQNVQQARFIAEKIRAENALRAKNEELDKFFSSALELLCIADTDGHFRRLNREWKNVLGYEMDELEGRRFIDLVHPDDREATIEAVSTLDRQEEVLNFTNRYRCKDGSYRWIEWRSFPAGKVIFAAARDITQRIEWEEALKKSEATLTSILRAAPVGIGLVKDRVFQWVNRRFTEITGYSPEDVLGVGARIIYPSDEDFESVGREKYRQIKEKGTGTVETRWQTKDGNIIDVLLSSTPVSPEDPSQGVIFTAIDITQTRKVQVDLKLSKERYKLATKAGKVGVFDYNLKTGNFFIDSTIQEFLGLNRPSDTYLDLSKYQFPGTLKPGIDTILSWAKEVVHRNDLVRLDNLFRKSQKESAGQYKDEYRIKDSNGVYSWILVQGNVIADESGNPERLVGTAIDITDRKKAQEEIETTRRQLVSMFDSLDEVVYVADPDTYELLYMNSPARHLFPGGIGDKCYKVLQDRDEPCTFCTNHIIFHERPGRPYIWEFQNQVNQKYYRCIDRAIPWEGDRMARFEMAIDVTDLKIIQKELQKSEEKFRGIAERSFDVIFTTDEKIEINYISPSVKKIFGFDTHEVTGKHFTSLLSPDEAEKQQKRLNRLITEGAADCLITTAVARDGREIITEISLSPLLKDNAVNGIQGIIRDVSHREMGRRRLSRLNEMFLGLGSDSRININSITKALGELLGADCALYNRLNLGILCSLGQWHVPPDFQA